MSVKSILKFAEDERAAYVNVRFTDLVGAWHHLTFPIEELSEKSFEEGFGFDGSSLRGWASIHESDMLLVPDPYRYWIDPFMAEKTLCLIADVVDPITKEGYWLDPRGVARRAESYLKFRASPKPPTSAPRPSSFSSTTGAFITTGTPRASPLTTPEPAGTTTGRTGTSTKV